MWILLILINVCHWYRYLNPDPRPTCTEKSQSISSIMCIWAQQLYWACRKLAADQLTENIVMYYWTNRRSFLVHSHSTNVLIWFLFSSIRHFESCLVLYVWLYLNGVISHISSSWDTSAVNHLQKCTIFTASARPRPLITFPLLFLCSPSSLYQRPSLLIHHASMVTFSHECPGNPPHLLFKSMQITTSKSSRASSEKELCTCGNWTSEGGGEGEGCVYTPPLPSHPQLCLCHASLQTISLVLLTCFSLANVKQARDSFGGWAFWKDKILCLWSRGLTKHWGLESVCGGVLVRQLNLGAQRMKDKCRRTRADWHYTQILYEFTHTNLDLELELRSDLALS